MELEESGSIMNFVKTLAAKTMIGHFSIVRSVFKTKQLKSVIGKFLRTKYLQAF